MLVQSVESNLSPIEMHSHRTALHLEWSSSVELSALQQILSLPVEVAEIEPLSSPVQLDSDQEVELLA